MVTSFPQQSVEFPKGDCSREVQLHRSQTGFIGLLISTPTKGKEMKLVCVSEENVYPCATDASYKKQ